MFDGRFRAEAERTLKPVGAQIKRTGIRADHLTLLGIASVILLTSIGEGIHRFVLGEFSQFGTNVIGIHPGKAPLFPAEEREQMIREVFAPIAASERPKCWL